MLKESAQTLKFHHKTPLVAPVIPECGYVDADGVVCTTPQRVTTWGKVSGSCVHHAAAVQLAKHRVACKRANKKYRRNHA